MSETCGTCRHWEVWGEGPPIGTCERNGWADVDALPKDKADVMCSHYRHVLSADHPAPPCYESKAKKVRVTYTSCSCLEGCNCDHSIKSALYDAEAVALDDIKAGEEVVIE